jgi:Transposase DDE domain.
MTTPLNIDANLVEIFYIIDEFCKEFDKVTRERMLPTNTAKKTRNRSFTMSDSEVITIMILFHLGHCRDLKYFYNNHICIHRKKDFPNTVSYNRFVELQRKALVPMVVFLQMCCLGKCTGISIIDSTPIRACHIKREHSNKTFKGIATKGKTTTGWFYGFKLHLIINDKGEIIQFLLTQGHVDDRDPLKDKSFHKKVFGKLFGDKGYISKDLFEQLFINNIHMITKIRKNMKNCLMLLQDKIILRQRVIIETVNDILKNVCSIEHTRHRSFHNFVGNMVTAIIAYNMRPKHPALNLEIIDTEALAKIA